MLITLLLKLNKLLNLFKISEIDVESKITKLKTIIIKTNKVLSKDFFLVFIFKSFSTINKSANSNPQRTKFHEAPCHNPVSAQTIKILIIQRFVLTLLPPYGI